MKVAVTSDSTNLEAPASPIFGRCAAYVFVETETMAFEALQNPAINAPSGAGIQAAQLVVEHGAQAVITGNVGPNAFAIFQSAGVPIYPFAGGTVRQAVEAFKAGQLQSVADANVPAHMGMGGGMGMGRGMGRGLGRGMGMGRAAAPTMAAAVPHASAPIAARDEEIAALRETASQLRAQLAEMIERLDRLEQKE